MVVHEPHYQSGCTSKKISVFTVRWLISFEFWVEFASHQRRETLKQLDSPVS